MSTRLRAKAATLAGWSALSALLVIDASTQMELLRGQAAVQTSDSWKCLDLSPGAGTGSTPACKGCALVEDLPHQVVELQEAVRKLQSIREAEEELDSWT